MGGINMYILAGIALFFCVLGVTMFIAYTLFEDNWQLSEILHYIGISSLLIAFATLMLLIIAWGIKKNHSEIEYHSSEYRLDYKVTVINGQSDTTYVLTKIKEKEL